MNVHHIITYVGNKGTCIPTYLPINRSSTQAGTQASKQASKEPFPARRPSGLNNLGGYVSSSRASISFFPPWTYPFCSRAAVAAYTHVWASRPPKACTPFMSVPVTGAALWPVARYMSALTDTPRNLLCSLHKPAGSPVNLRRNSHHDDDPQPMDAWPRPTSPVGANCLIHALGSSLAFALPSLFLPKANVQPWKLASQPAIEPPSNSYVSVLCLVAVPSVLLFPLHCP